MPEGDEPRGINILCMDGGGVRGLSSLILLGEIMSRLGELEGRYERPDPAEYFDVIAGSGTGGVSACMLGRLRMSMGQAISAYTKLVTAVFSGNKPRGTNAASAHKTTQLEVALKSIVRHATGNEAERMRSEGSQDLPKTIVFAMSRQNLNASIPVLFRSYESSRNAAPDCTIWEALYATMAHPDLFKSIDILDGPIPLSFVGGEIGCSNPISYVLSEVSRLYPDRYVSCVLSIGAGHARTISLPDPTQSHRLLSTQEATAMKDMAMDNEREAEAMAARFRSTNNLYYRFNVDQGMQDMNGDWEELRGVMAHTRAYIGKVEPGQGIDQAAQSIKDRKAAVSAKLLDGSIQVPSSEPVAHIKHFPAPSSMFTGREDRIQQISTCIVHSDNERRVCVIYGLGGAGKTQLALKTIERYQDSWTHTLFVDASSRETLKSTLQGIAKAKQFGEAYEDTLRWLATCREPWVMVYDNSDDPTLRIHEYFPGGDRGSILITTRLADMRLHARGPSADCRISEMSQEDSLVLLLRLAGMQGQAVAEGEMEAATTLLEDLGHFALGIVQAGSYIGHTCMSISEYRKLFLARRRSTLEQYRKLKVKVDGYQWSVFTAWKLCYDLLEESGAARPLLWLLAYTHHDQIKADMFECAANNIEGYEPILPPTQLESTAHEYVKDFLSRFLEEDGSWDPLLFSEVMSELVSYSLVDHDRSNATYSIHVLVQEWARTVIPQSPELALECATTLVAHAVDWDDTVASHRSLLRLGVHVIKVLSGRHDTVSANHAHSFAKVYDTAGLWDDAERLQLKALDARTRTLGKDHPHTLASMSNLASTYWNKGRWDDAEQLQLKVLEAGTCTLGEYHPDTLTSMGNLALTYWDKGRWDDAEQLELKVLEARRRTLGEDHPHTLTSMGNLASTYSNKGRWDDAEQLQLKVLEARTRTLGKDHPHTLTSMSNLASTYWNKGQWDDAEQLQLKVLEARTRTLGKDHPDTLTSMGNLAWTYSNNGRWDEAEQLQLKVLEACRCTLGKDHPDTLASMSNLASTYWNKGRWDDAEQLQLKVQEACRCTLGEYHPHTLTSIGNLASTYSKKGRWDEAEELELKVLDARRRTLGEDHPDTLRSMGNLASTYSHKGRWDDAEQLQLMVLEVRRLTLGDDHPDTLTSMADLACTYRGQRRLNEAAQLEVQVLSVSKRTLGREHPDTLERTHNLALTYADQGRWDEAEHLLVQAVEARTRIIGDQHPSTISSRECLADIQPRRPQRSQAPTRSGCSPASS